MRRGGKFVVGVYTTDGPAACPWSALDLKLSVLYRKNWPVTVAHVPEFMASVGYKFRRHSNLCA